MLTQKQDFLLLHFRFLRFSSEHAQLNWFLTPLGLSPFQYKQTNKQNKTKQNTGTGFTGLYLGDSITILTKPFIVRSLNARAWKLEKTKASCLPLFMILHPSGMVLNMKQHELNLRSRNHEIFTKTRPRFEHIRKASYWCSSPAR